MLLLPSLDMMLTFSFHSQNKRMFQFFLKAEIRASLILRTVKIQCKRANHCLLAAPLLLFAGLEIVFSFRGSLVDISHTDLTRLCAAMLNLSHQCICFC